MYSVMIVDDEQWVVQSLLDSVDWEHYGFRIIGTETHSPTALDKIRTDKPDLVFVDIRMPEISGLEMMKRCLELQLDTLFIVVSGFAEFSYVQKCMNLGGIGYCLKPVEEEELVPLLKKAKDKLDERAAKETPPVWSWLAEDGPDGIKRIDRLLGQAGIDRKNGLRAVMALDADNPELLKRYPHIRIDASGAKTVYVAEESAAVPLHEHLQGEAGSYRGIGLSKPIRRTEELREAVEDAEMAAYQYFIAGRPVVYQASAEKGFADFRQLYPALQQRDMSELSALFKSYIGLFKTGEYQIRHAFFLYNTVMTVIIQSQQDETEKLDKYLLVDYEQLIERYDDVYDLIDDLQRMSVAYLGGMYHKSAIRSDAFLAVLEYVNSNYHLNLSLQMLADKFFMNRNYIGQLFIKHVSQSFTDYLADLRVRHACELLKNSNLPIHSVGERVGYQDAYYFSKIFKKITGKTAREYRISG